MLGIKYRPDIDGLRALAILPVVLFHAKISGFNGGFIGVSMFFVVSGYLITSLIKRDIDAGQFSFLEFWERRARRILPPLFVVMLVTLIVGWIYALPGDFESLGGSALAQSFFISNIYFWQQAGYFDAASETKALLHTWSLSVEEQFYLLFPAFLYLVSKHGRIFRVRSIVTLLFLSLVASAWFVTPYPAATFFLLPTRAWELLLGAWIACLQPNERISIRAREIISWLALITFVIVVFVYDNDMKFPGLSALIPCGITAILIWVNTGYLTRVGKILSNRILVGIGLVSYSWYLWHWPILVFADYTATDKLSITTKFFLILLSLVLAILSWKFVETPVRKRKIFITRAGITRAAIATGTIIAISGGVIYHTDGFPDRMSPEVIQMAMEAAAAPKEDKCVEMTSAMVNNDDLCKINSEGRTPELLVWGDSHAYALKPLIESMSEEYSVPTWFASAKGCIAIIGLGTQVDKDCYDFNYAMLEIVKRYHIKNVLLVSRWSKYVRSYEKDGKWTTLISDSETTPSSNDDLERIFSRNLQKSLQQLQDAGTTVWIMEQVPFQNFKVLHRLVSIIRHGEDAIKIGTPYSEHQARQSFVHSVFTNSAGENVHLIDPGEIMCNENGFCRAEHEGHSLYRDNDHISAYGALHLKPLFTRMYQAMESQHQYQ